MRILTRCNSLVLIPGPGSPRVRTWAVCNNPAETTVGRSPNGLPSTSLHSNQLDYHVFEKTIALDDTFTWTKLLGQAETLLLDLCNLQRQRNRVRSLLRLPPALLLTKCIVKSSTYHLHVSQPWRIYLEECQCPLHLSL